MTGKVKFSISILLLLIVLTLSAIAYVYHTGKIGENTSETRSVEDARSLDMETASEFYEELANTENDADLRGRYSILAGLSANTAGNYERGVSLIKGVAASEAVSAQVKAEALIALLNLYYRGEPEPLQMIFDDDGIYAAALGEGDLGNISDLRQAVQNLYRTADGYHEYSFSKYAQTLGPMIELSREDIPETESAQALAEIRDLLDKGDLLYQTELADGIYEDTSNVMREFLLLALHLRLNAIEVLARHDQTVRADVDEEYVFTLGTFAQYDSPTTRSTESFVRLYYAAYLAEVYGEEGVSDIQQAVAPLMDSTGEYSVSNQNVIWPYFERELSFPLTEEGIEATRIRAIAAVDPAFKAFLDERGLLAE